MFWHLGVALAASKLLRARMVDRDAWWLSQIGTCHVVLEAELEPDDIQVVVPLCGLLLDDWSKQLSLHNIDHFDVVQLGVVLKSVWQLVVEVDEGILLLDVADLQTPALKLCWLDLSVVRIRSLAAHVRMGRVNRGEL